MINFNMEKEFESYLNVNKISDASDDERLAGIDEEPENNDLLLHNDVLLPTSLSVEKLQEKIKYLQRNLEESQIVEQVTKKENEELIRTGTELRKRLVEAEYENKIMKKQIEDINPTQDNNAEYFNILKSRSQSTMLHLKAMSNLLRSKQAQIKDSKACFAEVEQIINSNPEYLREMELTEKTLFIAKVQILLKSIKESNILNSFEVVSNLVGEILEEYKTEASYKLSKSEDKKLEENLQLKELMLANEELLSELKNSQNWKKLYEDELQKNGNFPELMKIAAESPNVDAEEVQQYLIEIEKYKELSDKYMALEREVRRYALEVFTENKYLKQEEKKLKLQMIKLEKQSALPSEEVQLVVNKLSKLLLEKEEMKSFSENEEKILKNLLGDKVRGVLGWASTHLREFKQNAREFLRLLNREHQLVSVVMGSYSNLLNDLISYLEILNESAEEEDPMHASKLEYALSKLKIPNLIARLEKLQLEEVKHNADYEERIRPHIEKEQIHTEVDPNLLAIEEEKVGESLEPQET